MSGELVGEIYAGFDGTYLPVPMNLPFSGRAEPDPDDDDMVLLKYRSAEVSLGRLETDTVGRLIFVPGAGKSESVTTPEVCIHKGGTSESFKQWLKAHDGKVTVHPGDIHNPTNPITGEYESNAGPIGNIDDAINRARYFAAWTDNRRIRGFVYDVESGQLNEVA